MEYEHDKSSFCDAVHKKQEQMDALSKKASDLLKRIDRWDGTRSELVEHIDKTIKKMSKKDAALLVFYMSEIQSQKAYHVIGSILGRIVGEAMKAAGEMKVSLPIRMPMCGRDLEDMFGQLMKKEQGKKTDGEEKDREEGMSYVQ